ncbi:hypothetical protein NI385_16520 [Vibrio parahaemolyticus]|nr:hypothetical protein NI385_16520 [Vibrio parahaemolyticus]
MSKNNNVFVTSFDVTLEEREDRTLTISGKGINLEIDIKKASVEITGLGDKSNDPKFIHLSDGALKADIEVRTNEFSEMLDFIITVRDH